MKKRLVKKSEITNKDLARMIGGLDSKFGGLDSKFGGLDSKFGGLDSKFGGLDSKIDKLGKSLDVRITRLESYMKEGFNALDNKIDHVDARIWNQIEGLGRRIDDLADNKVSRISYKELESRVAFLESKILPREKK